MSTDEDTELRDLVAQTLETNGVLNKIRAELRANVFLALEEQDALKKKTISNKALKSLMETKEGMLAFGVIREFLEFFNLDFTTAVLDPESNVTKAPSRERLINDFNMQSVDTKQPLLMELLKKKFDGKASSSPPSSPRTSKIPQRMEKKTTLETRDTKEKRGSFEDDDDEDDILKELGVSPINYNKPKAENNKTKPSWLTGDLSPSTSSNDKTKKNTTKSEDNNNKKPTSLGSLKDAPPLTGVAHSSINNNDPAIDVTSPEWDELINIDKKINQLGFEIPAEDNNSHSLKSNKSDKKENKSNKDLYNYDDDDFNSSVKSDDNDLSITEEIEENLSIGSFGASKNDDLLTSDRSVSQISETGIDYAEDAEFSS